MDWKMQHFWNDNDNDLLYKACFCTVSLSYSVIYYIVHLWLRLIVVSAFVIDNLVSAYSNIYNSNDHAALLLMIMQFSSISLLYHHQLYFK